MNTQKPKTVGILGGMGPQATILLQQKVLETVNADDDGAHVPLLIDMNPQVPSRLDWLLRNQGGDPGAELAIMSQRLEAAGAQALAMPCNTAHHFTTTIEQSVTIPLLNMLELAATRASSVCQPEQNVGILASPATRSIELFERTLKPYSLGTVWPAPSIDTLQSIIRIKAQGVSDADLELLQQAADDCVDQGATCLMVGCSEFSLLSNRINIAVPIIDSMDLLAQRIHDFSFSLASVDSAA